MFPTHRRFFVGVAFTAIKPHGRRPPLGVTEVKSCQAGIRFRPSEESLADPFPPHQPPVPARRSTHRGTDAACPESTSQDSLRQGCRGIEGAWGAADSRDTGGSWTGLLSTI